MGDLYQHILLLFSIPIYAVIIPAEVFLSHLHGWKLYSLKETLTNVMLNLLNAGLDLLLRGVALGILIFFYQFHPDWQWHPVIYWLLLFLAEDLMFWLEHYTDHHVRFFWAVHVTHHSSEEFNLSTGFRSSVLMPFYRYIYFIPLALAGFQPLDIMFMYAITQTYGILVHTQAIGKLPRWIEYIFVTPSHHRVHHASNVPYLDKNMGMVLIIWDRIFGTFTEEVVSEPPVYGLTKPLSRKHDPGYIIFHEWRAMVKDLKQPIPLKDKLGYLFKAPGWSHDGSRKTSKALREEWMNDQRIRQVSKDSQVKKKTVKVPDEII